MNEHWIESREVYSNEETTDTLSHVELQAIVKCLMKTSSFEVKRASRWIEM